MANRERRREEEEEEKEADEFLDERRVLDGQERFWSQESEVRLRILAAEERVKMSPQGQDWNPRYLLEAKESWREEGRLSWRRRMRRRRRRRGRGEEEEEKGGIKRADQTGQRRG